MDHIRMVTNWARFGRFLAIFAIAAGLVGAVAAPALAQDRERSNRFHEEAKRATQRGDLRAAIVQLKNAVRSDLNNLEARYDLGVAQLRIGDAPSAEKDLLFARERGFDERRVVVALGDALLVQNKFSELLDMLQPGERGRDVEARVLAHRGFALMALGRLPEAEVTLTKSLEQEPIALAHLALARVHLARGNPVKAEEELDKSLALQPLPDALVAKGELHVLRGEAAKGRESYDKAIAQEPNNWRARLARAALLVNQNADAAAAQDVQNVIASNPRNPLGLYYRALLEARRNDLSAAASTLQAIDPDSIAAFPTAQYLVGAVAYARNQMDLAEESMRRFVQTVPNHLQARKILAAAQIRLNRPGNAVATLQPAVDQSADDAQLFALLGVAHLRQGNFADAAQFFERASANAPDNAAIRTQLALSHLQLGQTDTAIKGLEGALDRDPNLREASVLLVLTHVRNQEFDKALAAIEDMRKQMPQSPLPDHYVGAVRTSQLDVAAARQSFEAAIARDATFYPSRLALARLDIAAGNLAGARAQYDAILARDANNVPAMLAAADLANREAKPGDVVNWLDRAIRTSPAAIQPRFQLANYLLARNDGSRALPVARELAQISPNDNVVLDVLARAQLAAGETASALVTFRQIVQRAPNAGIAHLRLAQAQLVANDVAGARDTLRRGTEVQADFLPTWQEFAALELKTGTVETAARVANEFRRRRPEDPSGDILLGDVYFLGGRFKDAADAFNVAFQRQASTPLATRLADAQNRAGNPGQAVQTLKTWADKNPDDPTARFSLASLYIQLGRLDDAVNDHEAMLKQFPDNPVLLNNLAWLLQDKDSARALDLAEKAHQRAPDSAAINDTYGWLVLQKGDNAKALPMLAKAATAAPENHSIRYHYAVGLSRTGRRDEAKRILEDVLAGNIAFEQRADAQKLLDSLR